MIFYLLQCPDSGQVSAVCTDEDVFHHAKLACSRFKGEPFSECHQTVSTTLIYIISTYVSFSTSVYKCFSTSMMLLCYYDVTG